MKEKIGNAVYWIFCLIALCLIFVADGGSYTEGAYSSVIRGILLYLIARDMRRVIRQDTHY